MNDCYENNPLLSPRMRGDDRGVAEVARLPAAMQFQRAGILASSATYSLYESKKENTTFRASTGISAPVMLNEVKHLGGRFFASLRMTAKVASSSLVLYSHPVIPLSCYPVIT